MLNNHLLKKAILFIVIAIAILFILDVIKFVVVAAIWFVVLFSLLGILLPTYIWTEVKNQQDKNGKR